MKRNTAKGFGRTKVLGNLRQLGTSVHVQNQFSQPVTVASHLQLQILVRSQPFTGSLIGGYPKNPKSCFRGETWGVRCEPLDVGIEHVARPLVGNGHIGRDGAGSWLGWIKWRLFCFGRVKICCCWSFIPSGNAMLRGNSSRNSMLLSWSFRELYLHLSQEPCGATKSGPAKSSQCKGLLRNPGTFARTIPYRLHVEWLCDSYVIRFLCDSYLILMWLFNDT